VKLIIQADEQLFGLQHLQPRRRQFDRQRNALQPQANLRDDRRGRVRQRETPECCGGAIDEETHGAVSDRLRGCDARRSRRQVEQRHRIGVLASDGQRLPAGGKQEHAGARLQKPVGELGDSPNHMFAVVEDEEHALRSQKRRDRVRGWPFPLHRQSEHGRDRLADQLGPVQPRKLDKPRAVREARQNVGTHA
jgi:hypothetical protein